MEGWTFAKGHGTGNDFVILPDPDGALPLTADLVAALCDRRRGIGADGVLRVVRSAAHPDAVGLAGSAEWFMDYWNADGSTAEMCGNGVRVYARYLAESGLIAADGNGLRVATRAGVVGVAFLGDVISADMGFPKVYAESDAMVRGHRYPGTAVDVGNPHLVCDVDDDTLRGLDLSGPPQVDPVVFPAGVNVEFSAAGAPPAGAELYRRMRVSERGSGETLSCGSGACAVAAVALRQAGRDDGLVIVDVPGGRLRVTFHQGSCSLAGPAVLVARGELNPNAFAPTRELPPVPGGAV
ncbi:MAG TPA: diaminopimelate epimerase [Micromonosporaceae bacterium]|nr:diaminopimelate epimerase [Micromonosporaceae bacterium]